MSEFLIEGGYSLKGEVEVGGAKNVVLPAVVAGLLTDEEVKLENVPLISDLTLIAKIAQKLGAEIKINEDHTLTVRAKNLKGNKIPLEMAAKLRASFMIIIPLLVALGKAEIPNPGGCRIGARPVGRLIEGLQKLGAKIIYNSSDGYFHATLNKFVGRTFKFDKNTHTGTETLILAAVKADGRTVLENAAQEPEVDDLIKLLNQMGASVRRVKPRTIVIDGVKNLTGTTFKIMSDRNEVVTFAIASLVTRGDVFIKGTQREYLRAFLEKLDEAGAGWEPTPSGTRFFYQKPLSAVDVTTSCHPGFMTDWQAPWALLMTQAKGESIIHETVYENRFQYVSELVKMGAKISLFNPEESFAYNFNLEDDRKEYLHAARVFGPTKLHNAILQLPDLRAGATLVLATLAAGGESYLSGIEHIDRGYEKFEERLKKLGAKIKRVR
ncbi:MAG: UDP-N-acetylglucosamine 1-carboxyvinyltransferase [Microgenomates group bacterium LiPW_16]|nr:MAG: UDP-N-acetylglucosamine 1-carboxyvinyltransferase [Microgenomates group bacterium LiPW_16]